jgi:hypothetical protein
MDGLGDLFGAIGELFGGAAEVVGENAIEVVGATVAGAATAPDDVAGANATLGRYLTGAPRALNVNDL